MKKLIEQRIKHLKYQRKINWKALQAVKETIEQRGDGEEYGTVRSVRQGMLETAVEIYDVEIYFYEYKVLKQIIIDESGGSH